MKWRLAPEVDLESVKSCKCLLVGAGSLGCQVARNLLAWGIRKITLIDNGKISYSNPVRQSLFTFDDCGKEKPKAATASQRLKEIFPSADTEGVSMKIPMPGYPVETKEAADEAKNNYEALDKLVQSHDAVFLLTDTRESRWLPTVLAQLHNKTCITAALGFDTYVVLRHGVRHDLHDPIKGGERLGCYFCSDIVAPTNSVRDRTLDQQCTVSRPALCTIASAVAAELLVSVLNAPEKNAVGASEVAEKCPRSCLGTIPQQIRGSIGNWTMSCLFGQEFKNCVACSKPVVEGLGKDGFGFVLSALNRGSYLEDVTGITKMMSEVDTGELEVLTIDNL
eukprot:TRINITY_DN5202_c0_g1_i1.p1 TRINITY_DN5202_c0_g1~~TRINITY_DN5202_c0_g1_i1.p1  ORF type:complete len:337 (+),score=97.36 TRINITY_DN5202_c0_g1_i1:677-1687(+)